MGNFNTLPDVTPPLTSDKVFAGRGTAVGAEMKITLSSVLTLFQTAYDARYSLLAGSSSIVTVGTITVGVWNGTPVGASYGGAGTITGALKGNGSGVVSQAAAADLSNGVTGSGAVVLATGATLTNPTLTTPTFSGDLAVSGTTQSTSTTTGALKSAGGLGVVKDAFIGGVLTSLGVVNASSVAAGNVGEVKSVYVTSAGAVNISGSANITTLALTAGDWDVSGHTNVVNSAGTDSTLITSISLTSATNLLDGSEGYVAMPAAISLTGTALNPKRINVSGSTTLYLVGNTNGTNASGWGNIYARRVR